MSSFFSKKNVAVRTGLEPATLGVTGRYSNQLNYRTLMILQTSSVYLKNVIPRILCFTNTANNRSYSLT